jgi:hypothetical protein
VFAQNLANFDQRFGVLDFSLNPFLKTMGKLPQMLMSILQKRERIKRVQLP